MTITENIANIYIYIYLWWSYDAGGWMRRLLWEKWLGNFFNGWEKRSIVSGWVWVWVWVFWIITKGLLRSFIFIHMLKSSRATHPESNQSKSSSRNYVRAQTVRMKEDLKISKKSSQYHLNVYTTRQIKIISRLDLQRIWFLFHF